MLGLMFASLYSIYKQLALGDGSIYSANMYFRFLRNVTNQIPFLELHSGHEHIGDWSRDVAEKLCVLPNSPEPLIYGLPVKALCNSVPWDTQFGKYQIG